MFPEQLERQVLTEQLEQQVKLEQPVGFALMI